MSSVARIFERGLCARSARCVRDGLTAEEVAIVEGSGKGKGDAAISGSEHSPDHA